MSCRGVDHSLGGTSLAHTTTADTRNDVLFIPAAYFPKILPSKVIQFRIIMSSCYKKARRLVFAFLSSVWVSKVCEGESNGPSAEQQEVASGGRF